MALQLNNIRKGNKTPSYIPKSRGKFTIVSLHRTKEQWAKIIYKAKFNSESSHTITREEHIQRR